MILISIGIIISVFCISLFTYGVYVKKHKNSKLNVSKFKRSKRISLYSMIILIILIFSLGIVNVSLRVLYSKDVNGYAGWRESNGQRYLYVEADDYYSLGYLEGKFLASQIINTELVMRMLIPYDEYQKYSQSYKEFIPEDYIREMEGMAEGATAASGFLITFSDILLQNTFFDLYYGNYLPEHNEITPPIGCTSFAAENLNGSTTIGQNFDLSPEIGNDGPFPSLSFVHTNLTGKNEIFSLRIGGMLSLPMAKTSHLSVVVNVISAKIKALPDIPVTVKIRSALEKSQTPVDFIDDVFNNKNQTLSYNIIVSNETDIRGVQSHPLDYKINSNETIIQSNRFLYDDWNSLYLNDYNYSLNRQLYAENLFEESFNDNIFTDQELIQILGTNSENGEEDIGLNNAILRKNTVSATLAFLTSNYFGIGNVNDGLGVIPI